MSMCSTMGLFSRRRWATGLAQQSNCMGYAYVLHMCCIFYDLSKTQQLTTLADTAFLSFYLRATWQDPSATSMPTIFVVNRTKLHFFSLWICCLRLTFFVAQFFLIILLIMRIVTQDISICVIYSLMSDLWLKKLPIPFELFREK